MIAHDDGALGFRLTDKHNVRANNRKIKSNGQYNAPAKGQHDAVAKMDSSQ